MMIKNILPKFSRTTLSYTAGIITTIVGLVVLIGWQFDITILKTFALGEVMMRPNTAFCFLLAGLALIFLQRSGFINDSLVNLCAAIIFLVGMLTLYEYIFDRNLGIDGILYQLTDTTGGLLQPNRMALNTTLNFVLISAVFFMLTISRVHGKYILELCLIIVLTISVVGLIASLFGLSGFVEVPGYTRIAINTAVTFIILCFGIYKNMRTRARSSFSIEHKLFSILVLVGSIIILISISSISSIQSFIQDSQKVEHSENEKRQLNELLTKILDVETGARGFVIIGNDSYADPLKRAKEELPEILLKLNLHPDDKVHSKKTISILKQLIYRRIEVSDELYEIRKSKGLNEAISLFSTGKGKAITDSIRVIIAQIISEENGLLQKNNYKKTNQATQTLKIIYISIGGQLLLLAFIFLFVNKDISGRKNAEISLQKLNEELEDKVKERTAELIQSEEKFAKAFCTIPDTILITRLDDGKIIEVNNAFEKITGYSREEAIGKSTIDLQFWLDNNERDEFISLIKDKGNIHDFETRFKMRNGSILDSLISADTVTIGKELCLLTIIRDVTERRKNEELLRKSEKRYRSTLDNLIEGCQIIDFNFRYIYLNDVSAKQGHSKKEKLIGRTMMEMYPGIENTIMFSNLFKCMKERIPIQMENEFTFADGTKGWFSLNFEPVVEGVFILSADIAERKKAEEEIRKINAELEIRVEERTEQLAEKNEELSIAKAEAEQANVAKSEFLSRMSHELRTPMNSILGFAQLMDMGELNPAHKKGINQILKSGKHLLDLINEVLDISKIEAGHLTISPEPVEIRGIISETIDIVRHLAEENQISLEFDPSISKKLFVKADRQRLKQVLLNLINNAVKYNRVGGSVKVECGIGSRQLAVGSQQQTEDSRLKTVRISVTDTGMGLVQENIEKLFNPFVRIDAERTGVEGTGLGLTISKKLIEAMGGKIGIESERGKGSTFWVELPQSESQIDRHERNGDFIKSETKTANVSGTLLYIEDNLSNIQLVEQIIETHLPSIRLITEMYGKSAVQFSIDYKPDLILLDLDLPDIHGGEVLKLLQSEPRTAEIPVIILSADAMTKQIEQLMEAGAKNYLTKPIDVVQFLKVVDGMMGKGRWKMEDGRWMMGDG